MNILIDFFKTPIKKIQEPNEEPNEEEQIEEPIKEKENHKILKNVECILCRKFLLINDNDHKCTGRNMNNILIVRKFNTSLA